MPTIARLGPYRFFFFSNEGHEAPHVHVQRERSVAKFWLAPVRPARSAGFSPRELRTIEALVIANHEIFQEAWRVFFAG